MLQTAVRYKHHRHTVGVAGTLCLDNARERLDIHPFGAGKLHRSQAAMPIHHNYGVVNPTHRERAGPQKAVGSNAISDCPDMRRKFFRGMAHVKGWVHRQLVYGYVQKVGSTLRDIGYACHMSVISLENIRGI
jgi:hypothetical protein